MVAIRTHAVKAGVILSCICGSVSAENLLINNSFEKGTDGWAEWGAVETTQSYAGAKAMTVSNSSPRWSGISQEVPILNDVETITVTGWMKTEDVVPGEESWEQATISVEFLDENGIPFEHYPGAVAMETGSSDWTLYEKTYELYPGTAHIRVIAALGNATGTASFDQFTLTQKKSDGTAQKRSDLQNLSNKVLEKVSNSYSYVKNGSFDNGKTAWEHYNASFPSEGRDGSTVLKVHNPVIKWGGATQEITLPKEAASVQVSGWVKCDSVVRGKESWDKTLLNIEFLDGTGKMVGDYPPAVAAIKGSEEWKFYHKRYSVTEGAAKIKLSCHLSNAQGTAYFDDIAVVLFDEAGREIRE